MLRLQFLYIENNKKFIISICPKKYVLKTILITTKLIFNYKLEFELLFQLFPTHFNF